LQLSEHAPGMATLKGYPTLRVQVCNLNLEVYVFLGVVTVQLGVVCSNYKVQVTNLNPPDLVGAVFRRRLTVYDSARAPVRQQGWAPTKNIEIPVHWIMLRQLFLWCRAKCYFARTKQSLRSTAQPWNSPTPWD